MKPDKFINTDLWFLACLALQILTNCSLHIQQADGSMKEVWSASRGLAKSNDQEDSMSLESEAQADSSLDDLTRDDIAYLWPSEMTKILAKEAGLSDNERTDYSFFLGDGGYRKGGQAANLLTYDMRIVRKGAPYDDGHRRLSGSTVGTYIDYLLEATIAFRSDLSIPISEGCDYQIGISASSERGMIEPSGITYSDGINYVTLKQGKPTTIRFSEKVSLAEASHLLGLRELSSQNDTPIQFGLRFHSCKVDSHQGYDFPLVAMGGGMIMDLRDYHGKWSLPSTEGFNNGVIDSEPSHLDLAAKRKEHAKEIADRIPGYQGNVLIVSSIIGKGAAESGKIAKEGFDKLGKLMAEGSSSQARSRSNRNISGTSSSYNNHDGSKMRGISDTEDNRSASENGQLDKAKFRKYAGQSPEFLVEELGSLGKGITADIVFGPGGGWVYVFDHSQQRRLAFCYGGAIGTKVGDKVRITFNGQANPTTILNLSSGKSAQVIDSF